MRGQTEGSHEEINVEEAIRIHGNMVYRLALLIAARNSLIVRFGKRQFL